MQEAMLLYTLDMDNDQFKQEDREIHYRIFDGITWSNANRLTNNNMEDLSPKDVNINDEWFIIWQQDGSIMYKAGLSKETKTDEFFSSVPNNYEIVVMKGPMFENIAMYTPDANPTDNFLDGGNTYYTNYLSTAKRLDITS